MDEHALSPLISPASPTLPSDLHTHAREYLSKAKAANTRKAYREDWQHFTDWCQFHGCDPLPASPDIIVLYLTDLARQGRKVSTLSRRLVAISQAHKHKGLASPTASAVVHEALKGIRREHGSHSDCVDALLTEDIRAICRALPPSRIGLRDRALILLGFAGAFRRSELVGLDIEDIAECPDGLRITLRRSKTDQDGEGRIVGVPYGSNPDTCPVRTYKSWVEEARIVSGPLFRGMDKGGRLVSTRLSDRAVAQIIQRAVQRAQLPHRHVAGHSLRAGHATSAAYEGVSERLIMKQTGHRSERMVRRYIREADLFRENSATRLGL